MKTVKTQPNAKRLVEALRETGYDFNAAIADIVDNSIAANATTVSILLDMNLRGRIELFIYDDGCGMDENDLINALTYGSNERANPASLGKYGIGLKTASTAFCRRLKVTSRKDRGSELQTATWDIDNVAKQGWQIEIDSGTKIELAKFEEVLGDKSGTCVKWEAVDRVMRSYKDPAGDAAQRAFDNLKNELKDHLSTVYQRFLDHDDTRATNINIIFNDENLLPWSPFCEGCATKVESEKIELETADGESSFIEITGYVLPAKNEWTSDEEKNNAKLKTKSQGFYVYRENRLIIGPCWLNLFDIEPHYSLCRIEMSFGHSLDETLKLSIAKSKITIPPGKEKAIKEYATPLRNLSNQRYRNRRIDPKTSIGAHDLSNSTLKSKEDELKKADVTNVNLDTNTVEITNHAGNIVIQKPVILDRHDNIFVETVQDINNGMLWQASFNKSGKMCVLINSSHPFYQKIYMQNIRDGITVLGMDALLYVMALAELNSTSERVLNMFEDLRFEVSRNLRQILCDLPDPEE